MPRGIGWRLMAGCLILGWVVPGWEQAGAQVMLSNTREEALRTLHEEEAELIDLYRNGEVSREDYELTMARHWVLRRYLQRLPPKTNNLPELHIVTKAELPSIMRKVPNLERLKVGVVYEQHWRYRGKQTYRARTFYIFERH